jgi:hypothetical protein
MDLLLPRRWCSAVLLALTLLCLAPTPLWADDHYYLAIFASDADSYRPTKTHCFATAIHLCNCRVETCTISWLPRSGKIRPLLPEPGRNFSLAETMAWSQEGGMHVAVWGPYEIRKELFDRFVAWKAELDGPDYVYCGPSKFNPVPGTVDCANALVMLTRKGQAYHGIFGFGEAASAQIVEELSPCFLDPCRPHREVLDLLGIDPRCLVRRDFCYRPTRWQAMYSMLGTKR